jgi:hypothetical protein
MAEVAKSYGKYDSSNCQIVKEKEHHTNLTATPHSAKVTATVHGKCSVKMEKTLSYRN